MMNEENNDNKSLQVNGTPAEKFLSENIQNLSDSARDELVKFAMEERIKTNEQVKRDELKTVNANNNFDRHIAALNSVENRGAKNVSHIKTDFEIPNGHMRLDSHTSHCYVATATYQNIDHPNCIILRDYRDRFLRKSFWGRVFIFIYYSVGKYLAFLPEHSNKVRLVSQKLIDKIVDRIIDYHYSDYR